MNIRFEGPLTTVAIEATNYNDVFKIGEQLYVRTFDGAVPLLPQSDVGFVFGMKKYFGRVPTESYRFNIGQRVDVIGRFVFGLD